MSIGNVINNLLSAVGYVMIRRETFDQLAKRLADPTPANAPTAETAPRGPLPSPGVAATWIDESLQLVPSVNSPPRTCTRLAPPFDPALFPGPLARNVVEFQARGITVIGIGCERATDWREAEVFDRDVGNRHPAWDWAGNALAPYSADLRSGVPSARLVEDLRALFSSADFEAFFRGVLGCAVTVGNCRLVKSLPHDSTGVGPQSWHEDGCPPGVIRGVLYLTDVDDATGPFQYKDDSGVEHSVLGLAGDLLVFDAMRLRHRAIPPTRAPRFAIDLMFMPRLPGQALEVTVAGMNHWPADPFAYDAPRDRNSPVDERRVVPAADAQQST